MRNRKGAPRGLGFTEIYGRSRAIRSFLIFELVFWGATLTVSGQSSSGFNCLREADKNAPTSIETTLSIPLDNTGIATHRALNPRNPLPLIQPAPRAAVDAAAAAKNGACYDHLNEVSLKFDNLTDLFFGVQFNISLPVNKDLLAAQLRDLVVQLREEEAKRESTEYIAYRNRVSAWFDNALKNHQFGNKPPLPGGLDAQTESLLVPLHRAVDDIKNTQDLGRPPVDPLTANDFKTLRAKLEDPACQTAIDQFNPLEPDKIKALLNCANTIKLKPAESALEAGLNSPSPEALLVRKGFKSFAESLEKTATSLNYLADWADGTPGKTVDLKKICKLDGAKQVLSCTPKIVVLPNIAQTVPGALLDLLDKGTATFTVTFENSADIPANSTGYLQTAAVYQEPADSTKWQLAAQIGAFWDPDTGKKAEMRLFTADMPFDNKQLQHFVGVGNFKLDQRLGNRAAATATLGFKKGDLGESDSSNPVKVPEYTIKLYGNNGLQLVFGKYTLASPSDGISVNAIGEGVELRINSLSFGHLVKRESADGEADRFNRDNRLYIAQVKNFSLASRDLPAAFGIFRTASLIGLYGSEKNAPLVVPAETPVPLPLDLDHCTQPKDGSIKLCYPYHYWTLGGELAFTPLQPRPKWGLSGTLALYHNQRDLGQSAAERTGDRVRDGRGTTGLFKLSYVNLTDNPDPQKRARFTLGTQVGYGSRDNPQDKVDHGYVGESTAFAPDQIFLSRFAGNIGELGGPTGKEHLVTVGPGLSNKTYINLNGTLNTWSLLALIANLFGITETPTSQSTTLKLHYYHFNEPRFDSHDAGSEADLSFLIEVPKGVTATLDFGYFRPGNALQPIFSRDVWRIGFAFKATI